jgi:putative transcriptional regulator
MEVFNTYKVGRCRIQELLDAKGMTQKELADKTGMSKQYINDKARNKRGEHGMWIDSAKTIASALNCSIDDLYEWIPDQEAQGKSKRK